MRRKKPMDNISKRIVSITLLAVLLVMIVTLAYNIQPAEAEPRNIISTYGKGYLEDINGLLVLHVKGSPYEMGYQNGFLLRNRIQIEMQNRLIYIINSGYSYEYLVNCARTMEPHIPEEYIEEMQGLADGANVSYTTVLIEVLFFSDIQFYGTEWTGCSGFVVFGNATKDGHLYHGRALDYAVTHGGSIALITVYEPEDGNVFVNVSNIGETAVLTGMNKEGITIQTNLSSSNDQTLDGLSNFFMLKKVLQYSNDLTEAIDIIRETDRTHGCNILLGDGKDLNACAVEISDNYCEVFWAEDPAEDIEPHYSIPNAVRRTNHYIDAELAATQRSTYDPRVGWEWSWDRYEKLSQLIEDNYGDIGAQMSIEFLRTPPIANAGNNLQSMVFDSTNLELWFASSAYGNPAYEREFIHLSYDDLFPEYPVYLTISSTTGGSITTPGEGPFTYFYGTEVNLVAEPHEGYQFVNWTGDISTIADANAAATTITMNGDYSITANFEEAGPCFIATAAYGTPMAEEIEILREFRDEYLLTNPQGQALVDFYYKVSPPMAQFITEHPSLKPIVRVGLLPAVAIGAVAVNITPAVKTAIVGLLALASVAVAILVIRRRGRGSEYT
jgi:isopenicillin-N N-acyltransferase-like protein